MNAKEYELLNDKKQFPEKILTAKDLVNKKDRTLLYGYTCDRDTWHVYIEGGVIFSAIYTGSSLDGNSELREIPITTNQDYVPNKRLYVECCDFEFCTLLVEAGANLTFTHPNFEREEKKFYGRIF